MADRRNSTEDDTEGAEDTAQDAWARSRSPEPRDAPPHVPPRPAAAAPTSRPRRLSLAPSGTRPSGDALDLVSRARPSQQKLDLLGELENLFALDDFTGALRVAELLLGRDANHPVARRYADECRRQLIQLYASRLGPLDQVPQVAVQDSDIRWLGLDHRSGFLLSRIDGLATIEEVLDICGMDRLEGLKTLVDLLERRAIALRSRA